MEFYVEIKCQYTKNLFSHGIFYSLEKYTDINNYYFSTFI